MKDKINNLEKMATENSPTQLALDFSVIEENRARVFSVVSTEHLRTPSEDLKALSEHLRTPSEDLSEHPELLPIGNHSHSEHLNFPKWLQIEQEILQRFGGDRTKKGWLSPQYKYLDECGNSHTTTDPSHIPATKIYGPYWTYRWFRSGDNDGNLYLGATSSNKFLRFTLVWEHSRDTTEILEKWSTWFGRKG